MKSWDSTRQGLFSDKAFLVLVVAVSLAFAWIVWPFFGAVFWATVLAILFSPLYRRLLRSMRQRRTLAALTTLLIILVMVILPSALIGALLLHEAFGVYNRVQSGELSFARYFQQVLGAQPEWVTNLLQRFGLDSAGAVQERLSSGLVKGIQLLASQALNVGQNALEFFVGLFIMLYLLFSCCETGVNCRSESGARYLCRTNCSAIYSPSSPTSSAPRSRAAWSWQSCKERSAA